MKYAVALLIGAVTAQPAAKEGIEAVDATKASDSDIWEGIPWLNIENSISNSKFGMKDYSI